MLTFLQELYKFFLFYIVTTALDALLYARCIATQSLANVYATLLRILNYF